MSSMSEPALPTPSPRKAKPRGLRTGKIHLTKASASEILRSVGVRPSDIKVAEKALEAALTRKPKSRNTR